MPIYEYRCGSCGNTIEVIQKFSDRPLRKCPDCAGRLEKLVSRTSFQLRGGGWFAQDYSGRSGSSKPDVKETPAKPEANAKKKDGGGCASGGCGCD